MDALHTFFRRHLACVIVPSLLAFVLVECVAAQSDIQPGRRWKPTSKIQPAQHTSAPPAARATIVTHAVPPAYTTPLRRTPDSSIRLVQAPVQRAAPEGFFTPLDQQGESLRTENHRDAAGPDIPHSSNDALLENFTGNGRTIQIPILQPPSDEQSGTVNFSSHNGRITLVARGGSLNHLLNLIAQQHGLNIIANDAFNARISVTLTNVPLEDALNSILSVTGYTWSRNRDIISITKLDAAKMSPLVQGRIVRVIPLNFIAADEVGKIVTGLLSPVGQSFSTAIDPANHRKTRESIVVEDLPEYVARVEQYLAEADRPPRQVMVEAHVLQVDLSDSIQHGVNFQQLARLANAEIDLRANGFAPGANPSLVVGVDGNDIDGVLEALKSTTNAKTLASPKVLVLNGQESRIQIGGQLGFLQSTTTETATLQNVQFIEVGVVLSVTPHISNDGRILLDVKPEVSTGRINPDTGLPEEETTEVETTVMLRDGQGMVIGGLIKEEDTDNQAKIPLLGDTPGLGRLFQRRSAKRERNEVVIALVPRIVPYDANYQVREDTELERATTPLLDNRLRRNCRPWEPRLPDAVKQHCETLVPPRYQPRQPTSPAFFNLSHDLTRQARNSVRTVQPTAAQQRSAHDDFVKNQPGGPTSREQTVASPLAQASHTRPDVNSPIKTVAPNRNVVPDFHVRTRSSAKGSPTKHAPPVRRPITKKRASVFQRIRSSRLFRRKEKEP